MSRPGNNFAYLLRMVKENQRKTVSEWNGLIRAALKEVDELIGETDMPERNAVLTFDEYLNRLQTLGAIKGFDMRVITERTD